MRYTSFKQRRALGRKYNDDPALEVERERLEQEYAMMPERSRAATERRKQGMQYIDSQRERRDRDRAGMYQSFGNLAKAGLVGYKAYSDIEANKRMLDIYEKSKLTSPNAPKVEGVKPVAPQSTIWDSVKSVGTGILSGVGSAYQAVKNFSEEQYVPGVLNTAEAGLGLYQGGKSAIDTVSGLTKPAVDAATGLTDTAGKATEAGMKAVEAGTNAAEAGAEAGASAGSALSEALPVAGAAIGVGKGLYDVTQAESGAQAVQGVWKMVDGVLKYVAPYYGAGRAAAGLVNAGLTAAGVDDKAVKVAQSVFDPAGAFAGEYGDISKLLGLDDFKF